MVSDRAKSANYFGKFDEKDKRSDRVPQNKQGGGERDKSRVRPEALDMSVRGPWGEGRGGKKKDGGGGGSKLPAKAPVPSPRPVIQSPSAAGDFAPVATSPSSITPPTPVFGPTSAPGMPNIVQSPSAAGDFLPGNQSPTSMGAPLPVAQSPTSLGDFAPAPTSPSSMGSFLPVAQTPTSLPQPMGPMPPPPPPAPMPGPTPLPSILQDPAMAPPDPRAALAAAMQNKKRRPVVGGSKPVIPWFGS